MSQQTTIEDKEEMGSSTTEPFLPSGGVEVVPIGRAGAKRDAKPDAGVFLPSGGVDVVPVSASEYAKPIAETPESSGSLPEPELPISTSSNIKRGLEGGLRNLGQMLGGTLPEVVGQAAVSAYDALRAPQPFPGMTNEQFTEMQTAREQMVPTENPMSGWSEYMRKQTGTRPKDMAAYAQDPRTTAEKAPYYETGKGSAITRAIGSAAAKTYDALRAPQPFPGMTSEQWNQIMAERAAMQPTQNPLAEGQYPVPQFGAAQQARLGYEVANMAPQMAPTVAAAIATGGTGVIPAIVAGVSGGAMEGLSEYEQAIEEGQTPQEGLRRMAIMGAGSAALNAAPWTRAIKLLPKRFQNRLMQGVVTGGLEGLTEMGEGGISEIAKTDMLPQTQQEWVDAAQRIAQGVWDERSVFLAAALTGFGGGILTDPKNTGARQKAQEEASDLLASLEDEPINPPDLGPGGESIGPPPQSNIEVEPMGPREPSPSIPPGAVEPELRMPYIPQDVAVPPAGRTNAPEMPVVPSQQAAINSIKPRLEEFMSRDEANRIVDDLAAQLGIQPVEPVEQPQSNTGFSLPKIKPSTDDPQDVANATYERGVVLGNELVPIESISGGTRQSDAKEVRAVDSLAQKIKGPNGFISRLIVDEDNNVVEGQHRLDALRLLGASEVPITRIADAFTGLPVEQMRSAIGATGRFRKEQKDQIIANISDMIREAGSVDSARSSYAFPKGYEEQYAAAFDAISGTSAPQRPVEPQTQPEATATPAEPVEAPQQPVADNLQEPVQEAVSEPFDIETAPMDRIDAFIEDEVNKMRQKERAVVERYLTPEQQKLFYAFPETDRGYERRAKMMEKVSDEAYDAYDGVFQADNMDDARKFRQAETLKERLGEFVAESEEEAAKNLELFFRKADFSDPIDTRLLREATSTYQQQGFDVNSLLRRARAAYGTWILSSTRDPSEAADMIDMLDQKIGIPGAGSFSPDTGSQPVAEFAGWQERPRKPPIASPAPTTQAGSVDSIVRQSNLNREFIDLLRAESGVLTEAEKAADKAQSAFRSQFAGDRDATVAAGDILKTDWEKLSTTKLPTEQLSSMIDMAVDTGAIKGLTPKSAEQFKSDAKSRIAQYRGESPASSAPEPLAPQQPSPQFSASIPIPKRSRPFNRIAEAIPADVAGFDKATGTLSFDPSDEGMSRVRDAVDAAMESLDIPVAQQAAYENAAGLLMDRVFAQQGQQAQQAAEPAKPEQTPAQRFTDLSNRYRSGGMTKAEFDAERAAIMEQPARPSEKPTKPPTPSAAEQKNANERVDKHGLTKTQMDYLVNEIRDKWDTLPRDAKDTTSQSGDARAVIKVPGDGTFIIDSQLAANAIHKRLTGKWIDESSAKDIQRDPILGPASKRVAPEAKPDPGRHKTPGFNEMDEYSRATGINPFEAQTRQREQQAEFEREQPATKKQPRKRKKDELGFINIGLGTESAKRLLEAAKQNFREGVMFTRGLPREVRKANVRRIGSTNANILRIEQLLGDLRRESRLYAVKQATSAFGKAKGRVSGMPESMKTAISTALNSPDKNARQQALQSLPTTMRPIVEQIRESIDGLSRALRDMGVVSDSMAEIIEANEGQYLRRTYKIFNPHEKWKEKIPQKLKEELRDYIASTLEKPRNSDEVTRQLNSYLNIADDIQKGTAVYKGRKLGTQDLATLSKRGEFPEIVKEVWGVEKDYEINVMETATSLANLVSMGKMQRDILNAGEGKFVFSKDLIARHDAADGNPNDPGYNAEYARLLNENELVAWSEDAKTDAKRGNNFGKYGPLGGAWVTRDFKKAMEDALDLNKPTGAMAELLNNLSLLNGTAKMFQTALSVSTSALNFKSNGFISMGNGHLEGSPKTVLSRAKEAAGIAGVEVFGGKFKKYRDINKKLMSLGVIGDATIPGELRKLKGEASDTFLARETKNLLDKMGVEGIAKTFNVGLNEALAIYQAGDDFWKAMAWLSNVDKLKSWHPNWSQEAIEQEAALRVRLTYPTYSEIPKWAESLRRNPFVAPFVPFVVEIPRVAMNSMILTKSDMIDGLRNGNTAQYRDAQRRVGWMAITAAMPAAASFLGGILTGINEDDEETLRMGLGPWDRASTVAWNKINRATGVAEGDNISAEYPYAVLMDPVTAFMRADSVGEGMVAAITEASGPFVQPEMFTKAIMQFINNQNDQGKPIYFESDDDWEKFTKTMQNSWRVLRPGTIRSVGKVAESETPFIQAAKEVTGQREVKVDLAKTLMFDAIELRKAGSEQNRDIGIAIRDNNPAEVEKQWRQRVEAHRMQWQKTRQLVAGMQRMNVSPELITQTLKDADLSDTERRRLVNGLYEEPKMPDWVKKAVR